MARRGRKVIDRRATLPPRGWYWAALSPMMADGISDGAFRLYHVIAAHSWRFNFREREELGSEEDQKRYRDSRLCDLTDTQLGHMLDTSRQRANRLLGELRAVGLIAVHTASDGRRLLEPCRDYSADDLASRAPSVNYCHSSITPLMTSSVTPIPKEEDLSKNLTTDKNLLLEYPLMPELQSRQPDSNTPTPELQSRQPDSNTPVSELQSRQPDSNTPVSELQSRQPDSNTPTPELQSRQPDSNTPTPDLQSRQPDSNTLAVCIRTLLLEHGVWPGPAETLATLLAELGPRLGYDDAETAVLVFDQVRRMAKNQTPLAVWRLKQVANGGVPVKQVITPETMAMVYQHQAINAGLDDRPDTFTNFTATASSFDRFTEAGQFWQAVLDELELQMARATFDTWLRNSQGLGYNGDGQTLVVQVKNDFAIEWLEGKLAPVIKRTLQHLAGKEVPLRFVLAGETNHAHASTA